MKRARKHGAFSAPSALAAASLSALALAGCGLLPGRPSVVGTSASASGSGTSPAANEVPTPPGAPARVVRAASTPVQAVRRFARAYINWNAADVAARLDALARESVGQARSELELEAQQTRRDRALHRGGVANAGVVEAVSLLPGGGRRYVVVTRERTLAASTGAYRGLAPAWHVSVATVGRVRATGRPGAWRWAVSHWQPES